MSIEFPERVIDIGDKRRSGMYLSFESETPTNIGVQIRGDGIPGRFRLVRKNTGEDENPWEDINIEDADIAFGVGEPDKAPTGGNFSLSYNGDSTGLVGLAFDITAGALQTALNANPAIGAGAVTVSKSGSVYAIAWVAVGARSQLAAVTTSLVPQVITNAITRVQTGDANDTEVQLLRLIRKPYAMQDVWTPYSGGEFTATEKQAGTAAKKSIRRLIFNAPPYGGTFIVNFPKPEIVKITTTANVAAKQVWTATVDPAASAAALQSKFFTSGDDVGPVWWYFTYNGTGTSPGIPAGGRTLAIPLVTADVAASIASKITAAIHADTKFDAVLNGLTVTVTASASGARAVPADGNTVSIAFGEVTPGSSGGLGGKYFALYDATGGLAVWYALPPYSSAVAPAGAQALTRQIQVNLNPGDTAATVASVTAAAINTDGSYTATFTGNIVTATDSVGGERDDAVAATSGFAITINQQGLAITANVAYNATGQALQNALQNYWIVTKINRGYSLQCSRTGAQPPFTTDTDSLLYPNGIEGTLNLNTYGMFLAFSQTTEDFLSLVFEGEISYPGGLPFTFYRESIQVFRDIIDIGTMLPGPTLDISEQEGTSALVTGEEEHTITFPAVFSSAPSIVEVSLMIPSGGTIFTLAVESDTITAAGFKVALGLDVPAGAGYKVSWRAKL